LLLLDGSPIRMLIVSTLQMPAQQGRSICEDSWNTVVQQSR